MVQKLLSRVNKKIRHITLLSLFLFSSTVAVSQSVLLPGDLVLVSVNAADNSFDFIPLVSVEAGTSVWFSDGDWHSETQTLSGGNQVKLTFNQDVSAGTNIHANEKQDPRFTAEGKLSFTGEGDRILVYQVDQNQYRFLYGIVWGAGESEEPEEASYSEIPESLTGRHNFLKLGLEDNYQYFLRNGASGTADMLREMVADPAKWRSDNKNAFPPFGTAFRLLKPPVVVFDTNISYHAEGDTIPLNVAIYGHDGSKLTVDAVFNPFNSTADSIDISKFRKRTFNFTGLIGDAVYGIELPISQDSRYEHSETAFFELRNLSKGELGDFVSHVAFIQDDDLPSVQISRISYSGKASSDFIEIQNNERVEVNLAGWKITDRSEMYKFEEKAILKPLERLRILHPDVRTFQTDQKKWLQRKTGKLQLESPAGEIISELEYTRKSTSEVIALNQGIRSEASTISSADVAKAASVSSEVSQPEEIAFKPGWYSMSKGRAALASAPGEEFFYWDESLQQFKKYNPDQGTEIGNLPLIRFLQEEVRPGSLSDSISALTSEENSTLEFELSASDLNENGVIDGPEGFNMLLNTSDSPINVSAFLQSIEQETFTGAVYPYLYLWPVNGQAWSEMELVEAGGEVPPGRIFWVRADSVFEPLRLNYQTGNPETPAVPVSPQVDPVSSIGLKIDGEGLQDTVQLNIFKEGDSFLRDVISPELEEALRVNIPQYLYFGAGSGLNWNEVMNFTMMEDQKVVIPLSFVTSESGQFRISINEWKSVPNGWLVKLEDTYKEESYDLSPGWSLEFEYFSAKNEANESEPAIYDNEIMAIEDRFRLTILPPGVSESPAEVPEEVALHQNFPNPFNPVTVISFHLPEQARVKLSVFNVVGQPVAVLTDGTKAAGDHEFEWDATGLPSGMYIYQLEVGNKVMTRKMTLVK